DLCDLLLVKPQLSHDRLVANAVEYRVVPRIQIHVLVPGPGRHDDEIAFAPVERLAFHDGLAAALQAAIEAARRVAVALERLGGLEELHAEGHRGGDRLTGHRVDVLEDDAIA